MKRAFYVTGTDTEIGKTTISAGLLAKAAQQGLRSLGLKPVASGCEETSEGLRNEDALAHMNAASVKLPYSQVNPIAFKEAIAPHLAAKHENRSLSAERIVGFCRGAMMTPADFVLVEGAGGWRVPLNNREMLSRVPQLLELPVILVVGVKLGAINHALLTAEAIRRDGLPIAGWVANCVDPNMDAEDENLETLKQLMPPNCLGVVPHLTDASAEQVAQYLDLSVLLGETV